MSGTTRWRLGLGLVGVLLGAYGAYRLLALGVGNLVSATVWLVGGVVLHDGVLAPLVLGLGALAARWLPEQVRVPATGALVVLGSLTLVAVPVLGRFGARPDNPTLLDRPYAAGWLVVAALVLGVAGLQILLRRRKGAERG
jgi:hypothetical protein